MLCSPAAPLQLLGCYHTGRFELAASLNTSTRPISSVSEVDENAPWVLKHTRGELWLQSPGGGLVEIQEWCPWSAVYNREFLGYGFTRGHVLQPAKGRHCI